jgi:hypothetical protein
LLSAIGDHRGVDGDSYLFAYDPARQILTRFTDVLSHVEHTSGDFGYGKIHGQIVPGRCGDAYFSTYWGTRVGLKYTSTYRGDALFRFDAATSKVVALDAPVPFHGIPSLAGLGTNGLVYGEAVDPAASEASHRDEGDFFVYDTKTGRTAFRSDDQKHVLFRNVMLDRRGRAYVAAEGGRLLRYTPGTGNLEDAGVLLPGGGSLRASTRPAPDGTVYGVTQSPDEFFALERDGTIRPLGSARGYSTSLALDADGSRFYYVPGAHGDSWEQGTPVIAVDTRTGAQHVITDLNALAEENLGLTLGGSYNVALDARRGVLYVGLNAGKTSEDPWGDVVLAIIKLR